LSERLAIAAHAFPAHREVPNRRENPARVLTSDRAEMKK
jgi:hypothetical protein